MTYITIGNISFYKLENSNVFIFVFVFYYTILLYMQQLKIFL